MVIIIALALALRLYGIGSPFLDSHAERQAQVALAARNLYQDGMNIWCLRLDVFGKDSGCTLLEFPIVQSMAALFYYVFGEHEVIGRLISVGFSMGSVLIMYRLARMFLPSTGALTATGIYALTPLSIYFGRAFMAESALMFFSLAAVYLLLRWLEKPRGLTYGGAVACAALAYLAKTTGVILVVPLGVAWLTKYHWQSWQRPHFWAYWVLTLLPVGLWTVYSVAVNEANSAMPVVWKPESTFTRILGSPAVWSASSFYLDVGRWAGALLTPLGLFLAAMGLFYIGRSRWRPVVYAWVAGMVMYFIIFAGAIWGHDYYLLPLLPVAALLAGYAVERVTRVNWHQRLLIPVPRQRVVLACLALVLIGHGVLYYLFFSYMYNTKLRMPYTMEVAGVIREHTSPDAAFILNQPSASTTVVTYYSGRKSWSLQVGDGEQAIQQLEDLRARGASAYVAVDTRYGSGMANLQRNEAFWRYLNERYKPMALTANYAIFDLTKPNN